MPKFRVIVNETNTVVYEIEANDEVVFLCLANDLQKAEELFKVRDEY